MLKIKDNIDFKELEKFGFQECEDYYNNNIDCEAIYIMKSNRQICMICYDEPILYVSQILFDLIKNDMVQKVLNNKGEQENE